MYAPTYQSFLKSKVTWSVTPTLLTWRFFSYKYAALMYLFWRNRIYTKKSISIWHMPCAHHIKWNLGNKRFSASIDFSDMLTKIYDTYMQWVAKKKCKSLPPWSLDVEQSLSDGRNTKCLDWLWEICNSCPKSFYCYIKIDVLHCIRSFLVEYCFTFWLPHLFWGFPQDTLWPRCIRFIAKPWKYWKDLFQNELTNW